MTVLRARDLGKAYRRYRSEWQRVAGWFGWASRPCQEQWVLRGVCFDVAPGEAVGIVGQNGAGKSTLLKLVTGTLQPTEGFVHIDGRVAAILELGMGFNPELTGRQNVVHAAGLMGLGPDEIARIVPQVMDFAEIGEHFDLPVRTYSSGMQMRVAFAVATAVRPDILIVDEALSVGDSYFQHKSFQRIREFKEQGAAVLLVTHSMGDVRALCDRAILIDKGRVTRDGLPDEVVDYYNAMIAEKEEAALSIGQQRGAQGWLHTEYGTREARVESIRLLDATTGEEAGIVRVGQQLLIRIEAVAAQDVPRLVLGHRITDRTGHVVWGTNTWHTRQVIENVAAGSRIVYSIRFTCTLGPGSYAICFGLVSSDDHLEECYHKADNPLVFEVVNVDRPHFIGSNFLDACCEIAFEHRPAVPVRIAIISTPRSGNTWLRLMLAGLYQAEQIAVHSPDDVPWAALPGGNCVLQLHWPPTETFVANLERHGFHVIVLQRHPLDVLLSILQFAPHEPQTACWLMGEGGNEERIAGCSPGSEAFLEYAVSPRARALLSISPAWSGREGVVTVRYEELVADPERVLSHVQHTIGPGEASLTEVISQTCFERLKPTAANRHFWKGEPGLWRKLMPPPIARQIHEAHASLFQASGYSCDSDLAPTTGGAEQAWRELCR